MALENQIFDLARWLLMAAALWWSGGAVLWLGALGSERIWLERVASTVALPGTRRIAQAILAVGLTTLSACSPDRAAPSLVYLGETATTLPSTTLPATTLPPTTNAPTTNAPDDTGTSDTGTSDTGAPDAGSPDAGSPDAGSPDTAPAGEPPADPDSTAPTGHHRVVVGDHLWGIAAQHLTSAGETPTNEAIADYWRRVITTNAATIRSGDPNLIFPGEVLSLPPLSKTAELP